MSESVIVSTEERERSYRVANYDWEQQQSEPLASLSVEITRCFLLGAILSLFGACDLAMLVFERREGYDVAYKDPMNLHHAPHLSARRSSNASQNHLRATQQSVATSH